MMLNICKKMISMYRKMYIGYLFIILPEGPSSEESSRRGSPSSPSSP